MIPREDDYFRLILENLESGIALLDDKFVPVVYTPQFEQLCTTFSGEIRTGIFGIPKVVVEKIRAYKSLRSPFKKAYYHITGPGDTVLVLSVKSLQTGAGGYFLVTLHSKRPGKTDLYLALKEVYGINEKDFELLYLIRKGWTNKDLAQMTKSTEASVKMRLSRLYQKFEVANRAELVGVLEEAQTS